LVLTVPPDWPPVFTGGRLLFAMLRRLLQAIGKQALGVRFQGVNHR
jgi:hypothetical protein